MQKQRRERKRSLLFEQIIVIIIITCASMTEDMSTQANAILITLPYTEKTINTNQSFDFLFNK